jgi:hypothetical protein
MARLLGDDMSSWTKKTESRLALVLKVLHDDPDAEAACGAYVPYLTKRNVWTPRNYGGYLEFTDGILRYGLAHEIITTDEFKLAQPYLRFPDNRIATHLLAGTISLGLSALTGANLLPVVLQSSNPKRRK